MHEKKYSSDEWVIAAKVGAKNIPDYSLVLSAVGIEHQLDRNAGIILVCRKNSKQAMSQLRAFQEENQNWPPPARQRPVVRTDNPPTLLMITGLIFFYTITGPWFSANPWFQAGAVNSDAILEQNQWWRLITALTLHADQVHLVGNCVIGGVMVHLLCRTIGYGTAWMGLILSGLSGNLLNIILRDHPHYSVGFSTAVFAAIGIFCGRQLNSVRSSLIRRLLPPLGAAVGLLAMLGTGGERTDLGAHLFGLGCGLGCGLLIRTISLDLQGGNRLLQRFLLFLTLALISLCWLLAAGEQGMTGF